MADELPPAVQRFVANLEDYDGPLREAERLVQEFADRNDEAGVAAREMAQEASDAADKVAVAYERAKEVLDQYDRGLLETEEAERLADEAARNLADAQEKAALALERAKEAADQARDANLEDAAAAREAADATDKQVRSIEELRASMDDYDRKLEKVIALSSALAARNDMLGKAFQGVQKNALEAGETVREAMERAEEALRKYNEGLITADELQQVYAESAQTLAHKQDSVDRMTDNARRAMEALGITLTAEAETAAEARDKATELAEAEKLQADETRKAAIAAASERLAALRAQKGLDDQLKIVNRVTDAEKKNYNATIKAALGDKELAKAADEAAAAQDKQAAAAKKATSNSQGFFSKLPGWVKFLIAAIPLLPELSAGLVSLASGLGAAAAGIGSFAVFSYKDFETVIKNIGDTKKQLDSLKGTGASVARAVVPQIQALEKEWEKLSSSTWVATDATKLFEAAIGDAKALLPQLVPIAQSAGKGLINAFQQVGQVLRSSDFQQSLKTIAQYAGQAIEQLTKFALILGNVLSDMLEAAAPAFKPMMGILDDLLNVLDGPLVTLLQGGAKMFGYFAKAMGTLLGPGQGVEQALNLIASALVQFARALAPLLPPLATLVNQLLKDAVTVIRPLIPALSQAASVMVGALLEAARGLVPVITALSKALGVFFGWISKHPAIAQLAGDIGAVVVTGMAMSKTVDMIVKGMGGLGKMIEKVAGIVPKIGKAFEFLTGLPGKIAEYTGKVMEFARAAKIAAAATKVWEGAQVAFNTIMGALGKVGEGAGTAVSAVGKLISVVKEWSIWSKIAAAATKVWEGVQVAFNAIMSANPIFLVVAGIAALVAGVILAYTHFKAFRDAVKDTWHVIEDAAKEAWNVLRSVLKDIVSGMTSAWHTAEGVTRDVWDAIKSVITDVWDTIKSVVGSAINWVKNLIREGWDDAVNFTRSAWDRIVSAVESVASRLLGFVRTIPHRILSALGDMGSLLVGAGRALVEGLISGIESMVSSAVSAAVHVGSAILGGIKSILHIGSPSKAAMEIGQQTMQGLALGITSSESLAAMAARRASSALLSGLASPVSPMVMGAAAAPMAMAGAGGGTPAAAPGGTVHVHLEMNGREIANAVVPNMVAAVGKYGLRNSGRVTGQLKPG